MHDPIISQAARDAQAYYTFGPGPGIVDGANVSETDAQFAVRAGGADPPGFDPGPPIYYCAAQDAYLLPDAADPADAYIEQATGPHAIEGCTCTNGHCWDQAAVAAEEAAQQEYEATLWRDDPPAWTRPIDPDDRPPGYDIGAPAFRRCRACGGILLNETGDFCAVCATARAEGR